VPAINFVGQVFNQIAPNGAEECGYLEKNH